MFFVQNLRNNFYSFYWISQSICEKYVKDQIENLDKLQQGTRGQRIRSKGKFDIAAKQFEEQLSPFIKDGQFDEVVFDTHIIYSKNVKFNKEFSDEVRLIQKSSQNSKIDIFL